MTFSNNYLFCSLIIIGSEVKSSYAGSDERPMAVCEFGGFVAVESKNLSLHLLPSITRR